MPTILRPPVAAGQPYEVRFTNDVASTGVAIVIVAWVPKNQNPVPRPQQIAVVPGGTASITGTIPSASDARRMVIVIDLDQGEFGDIELLENDTQHFADPIIQTTTFGLVVV